MEEERKRIFAAGMRAGRLEPQFVGWQREPMLPAVRFRFDGDLFEALFSYERDVLFALRRVQELRWIGRQEERRSPVGARSGFDDTALATRESGVERELHRIRAAVDSELEAGYGHRCQVEALRAEPEMPADAIEFASEEEFFAGDGRRGERFESGGLRLVGADFGFRWSLENPFRRWETTTWRICWLCEKGVFLSGGSLAPAEDRAQSDEGEATNELYAREEVGTRGEPQGGRVWLLGKLSTTAAVFRALDDELRRYAMGERNSLIVAADAIARVRREEAPPESPY
jgi:hypothetical protein